MHKKIVMEMNKRRIFAGLLVAFLLLPAILLTGCSADRLRAGDGEAGQDIVTVSIENITLSGKNTVTEEMEAEINKITVPAIGCRVRIVDCPIAEHENLLKRIQAGIVQVDLVETGLTTSLSALVSSGQLLALDDLLDQYGAELKAKEGQLLQAATIDDRIYTVPANLYCGRAEGIGYNSAIAQEYGLDMSGEMNLARLTEIGRELKENGAGVYLTTQGDGSLSAFSSFYETESFGGDFVYGVLLGPGKQAEGEMPEGEENLSGAETPEAEENPPGAETPEAEENPPGAEMPEAEENPPGAETLEAEGNLPGAETLEAERNLPDAGEETLETEEAYDFTIQNIYETDLYRDYCKTLQLWRKEGLMPADSLINGRNSQEMFNHAETFFQYSSVSPGTTIMAARKGLDFEEVYIPITRNLVRTDLVQEFAWGITSSCAYPEKAMELLNLLYTNAELANLMQYGREGIEYERVGEDMIRNLPPVDGGAGYSTYFSAFGDSAMKYRFETDSGITNEDIRQYAAASEVLPTFGYVFNSAAVINEIRDVSEVTDEYRPVLETGMAEDVDALLDEFIQKLKAAGIDRIIAENQRQLDAWLESHYSTQNKS